MMVSRLVLHLARSQSWCTVLTGHGRLHHLALVVRPAHTGPPASHRGPGAPGASHQTRLMLDQEYKVQRDTILFKYDNPRFFKLMNFFAISQFVFWLYLSHFAFTTMKDIKIPTDKKEDKTLPWWKKINFGQYRNGITIGSFTIGWGTMTICWMYTLRSVRYLVLKKGGKELDFITYTPFGSPRTRTVPLEKVSAKQSRQSVKVHLPLKVQGTYFNYILDMNGHFTNSKLFDYSAGLKRSWAK